MTSLAPEPVTSAAEPLSPNAVHPQSIWDARVAVAAPFGWIAAHRGSQPSNLGPTLAAPFEWIAALRDSWVSYVVRTNAGAPAVAARDEPAEAERSVVDSPNALEATPSVDAPEPPPTEPAGPAIAELRMTTGFTWDQLATLFGVSRRALHFWASGEPMNRKNEEHLRRTLAVIRTIDRGSADANRAALFGTREDGHVPFDLLVSKEYERVSDLLGAGPGRPPRRPVPPEILAARAPRPPEELVGALQDTVHLDVGVARAAKRIRVRGDG